jgi:hypothetical protein
MSNFSEVGRSYKNIVRVSLGFQRFNFGIWVNQGLFAIGLARADPFVVYKILRGRPRLRKTPT